MLGSLKGHGAVVVGRVCTEVEVGVRVSVAGLHKVGIAVWAGVRSVVRARSGLQGPGSSSGVGQERGARQAFRRRLIEFSEDGARASVQSADSSNGGSVGFWSWKGSWPDGQTTLCTELFCVTARGSAHVSVLSANSSSGGRTSRFTTGAARPG